MMVDQEIDMLPNHMVKETLRRKFYNLTIEKFLTNADELNKEPDVIERKLQLKLDIVFCRQAVNYWMNPECAASLANIINPGGLFIFNTFNTKPSTDPIVKEYYLYDIKFIEISYIDENGMVHHVQIREGLPPHTTQFRWLSKTYFKNCLDKWFNVDIITKNKTDVYKCTKKG